MPDVRPIRSTVCACFRRSDPGLRFAASAAWGVLVVLIVAACFVAPIATSAADKPASPPSNASPSKATTALFDAHCVSCHDPDSKKGDLDLSALSADLSNPAAHARWVKVYDRIASGEMPPKNKRRPADAEVKPALAELSAKLTAADLARRAGSGRATYRRLTRAEYENTLADLLDLPGLPVRDELPPDGSAHGFNKVSAALDVSHVQMAKYMEVAARAIDLSVATRPDAPMPYKRRMYPASQYAFKNGLNGGDSVLLKDKKLDPAWPLIESEGQIKDKRVELYKNVLDPSTSAVGTFRHTDEAFNPGFQNFSPIIPGRYRIRLSVWSFWYDKGQVLPSKRTQIVGLRKNSGPVGFFDAPSIESKEHEVEVWLDANDMLLVNTSTLEEVTVYNRPGRAKEYQGPGVAIDWLEVEGPIYAAWPPESHKRLFGEMPLVDVKPPPAAKGKAASTTIAPAVALPERAPPPKTRRRDSRWPGNPNEHGKVEGVWTVNPTDPKAECRKLLASFLTRAFRRPATGEQVDRYAGLVAERLAAGDAFEDAMRLAYQAALCAPEFLFRIEPASGKLDDYAVATRLSYFLWNSAPDDVLIDLAAKGKLGSGDAVRSQVARMLADPKSERFVVDFLDQWLSLNEIASTTPDKALFPEFKPYMQDCMLAETRAFFRRLLDGDRGVRNLIDSDFAMLNAELGRLYGIDAAPPGHAMAAVPLPPNSRRGGLMTQAAVLKVTANGTVTSPVKRGAWVVDRLLGQPPDPPPPTVAAVDPDLRGTTTIREQLARHRDNPGCTSCHAKMDPPGFALESYDVIGRWRDRYRSKEVGDKVDAKVGEGHTTVKYRLGPPVDCTGETAAGQAFKDVDGLKKILLADERQVARNLLQRLTVYATGGEVGFADRPAIERILDRCAGGKEPYGVRRLIEELVASELFLEK